MRLNFPKKIFQKKFRRCAEVVEVSRAKGFRTIHILYSHNVHICRFELIKSKNTFVIPSRLRGGSGKETNNPLNYLTC